MAKEIGATGGTTLKFNFLFHHGDREMLPNYYIKVHYRFTIIRLTRESTLKLMNDTRCKFFGREISETINV